MQTAAYSSRPSIGNGQTVFIERRSLTDGSRVFNVVIVEQGSPDTTLDCIDGKNARELLDAIAKATNIPVLRDGDFLLWA